MNTVFLYIYIVDGGFSRKACYWDFVRHLDRLDAVMMTRLNNSNIQGLSSVLERKRSDENVYPQIGHFFCNIPDRKNALLSPDGDKDRDPLLIDLFKLGHNLINDLKYLNIKPQKCYNNIEPINLYHKVGHGKLDLYVISPSRDSKDVKEFLQKWNSGDQRLFATQNNREFTFPIQNLVSICALLVWQPADPEESITRILFPGSTPDYKILEGFEKIKHLEFIKHSSCTASMLSTTMRSVTNVRKTYKSTYETSMFTKMGRFSIPTAPQLATQQDNKMKDHSKDNISEKIKRKEDSIDTDEQAFETGDEALMECTISHGQKFVDDLDEDGKDLLDRSGQLTQTIDESTKEIAQLFSKEKPRAEIKPSVRSRVVSRSLQSTQYNKTTKTDIGLEKHQTISMPSKNIKSKTIKSTAKYSPSSNSTKSSKDANNRKVIASKQQVSSDTISMRSDTTRRKIMSTEKKDINVHDSQKSKVKRARAISPTKKSMGSPIKSIKPRADIKKNRFDKDGTTDSSLVSTPSADDVVLATKKFQDISMSQELDYEKERELDDLKEEQEVVREIEAVFNRD